MAEDTRKTGKGKKESQEPKITAREYLLQAGYTMELVKSEPSLQEFVRRVKNYMSRNKGRIPTEFELREMKQGIDWFERYNSDQEKARLEKARAEPGDWERTLEIAEQNVRGLAANYGVELTPEEVRTLATDIRLNKLTDIEIRDRFAPILQRAITQGADLSGRAAEAEREILQWSRRNGLQLNGQTLARYVQANLEGRSTIDDIKDDLRRTYLIGQYPGWSDRIEQGFDPEEIAQPYRQRMAALLEIDESEIDLNDNLLQRGMQSIGPDGKPRVMPLYEFEKEIRKDPRWEFTDNAYDIYSRVGENILRTFGFR